jgi:hypothetical protein
MLAFGLIREACSFTHPCSSQESYLKTEAGDHDQFQENTDSLDLFLPKNAPNTLNVLWNGGVSITNRAHSAPMILPCLLLTM